MQKVQNAHDVQYSSHTKHGEYINTWCLIAMFFIEYVQMLRHKLGIRRATICLLAVVAAINTKVCIAETVSKAGDDQHLFNCHTGEAFSPPTSAHNLTVLIHGNAGNVLDMAPLARIAEQHQQITACFTYNQRHSMKRSARLLSQHLDTLNNRYSLTSMRLVGHSLGGLIARKSLTMLSTEAVPDDIQLVTIAAPFAGVRIAEGCGNMALRVLSLGIQDLACWFISGDKWHELTTASRFIQQPGALPESLSLHLHIITQESDSCRYYDMQGQCITDDFVFTPYEQQLSQRDRHLHTQQLEITAGHTEIIGKYGPIPDSLRSAMNWQFGSPLEQLASLVTTPAPLSD
ncbi:Uncharacterised protein [BD1-7 clade bacterium]|uniref:DUF676 domain-containing protein n=1 Tax=BD1-7 clade bacterium TaxID=2029982 RepID=A0A5S9QPB4_9GAMM|nr:Uncharacterised protein [BD1-7 clade bacterium]